MIIRYLDIVLFIQRTENNNFFRKVILRVVIGILIGDTFITENQSIEPWVIKCCYGDFYHFSSQTYENTTDHFAFCWQIPGKTGEILLQLHLSENRDYRIVSRVWFPDIFWFRHEFHFMHPFWVHPDDKENNREKYKTKLCNIEVNCMNNGN